MRDTNHLPVSHVLLWLAISSILSTVSPMRSHLKPSEVLRHGGHDPGLGHSYSSSPSTANQHGSYMPHSKKFNVLLFGATGDGVADDSKAFKAAWKAACLVPRATIELPSEFKFLVRPITLQGPCMPHLVLQIDGTLVAPSSVAKSNLYQWINIKWLHDFTIQGSGTVDGQGFVLWNISESHHIEKETKYGSSMRPTVIRLYKCYNVTVRNIRIINSPLCHLKFDSSQGVKVKNITISSPKDSPNTDGIHLQNTQDVEIKHSDIGCGDDCVSIQTGCSNVHIHHLRCSPGHGISVGGLGKGSSLACVSNISVNSVTVQNALSGVRIKTWQGGVGSVRNVSFSNVQVVDVDVPIVIDQYYCNRRSCRNRTDAVAISEVTYKKISGTYRFQPMNLACSDGMPCTGVALRDIELSPANETQVPREAFCWKSYGESQGLLHPLSLGCLQRPTRLMKAQMKSHNDTCYY
ncbi:polygalacturonase At1g48100-like [Musa acuminata AAA Group]|uniref:polygalacturonase At1g48100-like n=1 Tax=Musa acuminata AAA Group TaxID=214697 RepID=UPI0031CDB5CD